MKYIHIAVFLSFFIFLHPNKSQCQSVNLSSSLRKLHEVEFDLKYKLLDVYARIFSDEFPNASEAFTEVSVPRNYDLSYQLVMRSAMEQKVSIRVMNLKSDRGIPFNGDFKVYNLIPVHVEGNTQGSLINKVGGPVPEGWKHFFVRQAPFDVFEVPKESKNGAIDIRPQVIAAALIKIQIPANCQPELYSGTIHIKGNKEEIIPISFRVHQTVVPKTMGLNSVHWLSERPEDLTSGPVPEWWSATHWNLLKAAGAAIRNNGDNMMFTPLINGRYPLIQTYIDARKNISFDYSRFDRWIKTYSELGFQFFSGKHLIKLYNDVYFKDSLKGTILTYGEATTLDWFVFLELFLKDFNRHLEKNNWKNQYVQHLYDEPSDIEKYKLYAELLRKCMPDVRSIDAINFRPDKFTGLVDAQVFNLTGINLQKVKVVKARLADQKAVWLYNCSSPYPPYPNRHLDQPLVENRLWPLLCYNYGASGYLWWAANLYRGVKDEYAGSLGPGPSGSLVHPPGDNWFYYRSKDGLLPSLRIIAFKEGMVDVTLLKMLEQVISPAEIEALIGDLIFPEIEQGHTRPFKDYLTTADVIEKGYSTDPAQYHRFRVKVLELLDTYTSNQTNSITTKPRL